MKRLLVVAGLMLAALGFSGVSHADTTTATDPCRAEGNGTVIAGNNCGPQTPTFEYICSTGRAHAIVGNTDYCPAPKVVLVGEYELGTTYVPHLFKPTRLDVKMGKGSARSRAFRCGRLGGSYVTRTGVCRNVSY